jgi:hypothetical protein
MIMSHTVGTDVQAWDAYAQEWRTVTVTVPDAAPRRESRARRRRPGAACDLAGLAATSPIPADVRYTAYAPCEGFADMRTFIKAPTIQTHRAPTPAP